MSKKDTLKKITGTKHLKSQYKNNSDIILRDFLALERTTLANERTLFAYLRAGIYMVIAGIAFLELEEFIDLVWLSYALFTISFFLFLFGFIRFFILKNKLDVYYNDMEHENLKKEKPKEDKTQEPKM
jgi:putative membrane protein